jgi:hypothetical protein
MSEQYPISREEFLGLASHNPGTECQDLCADWEDVEEQFTVAETAEERARILRLIKAVNARLERLNCPDCRPQ